MYFIFKWKLNINEFENQATIIRATYMLLLLKSHFMKLNPDQSSEIKTHLKLEDKLLLGWVWQHFN